MADRHFSLLCAVLFVLFAGAWQVMCPVMCFREFVYLKIPHESINHMIIRSLCFIVFVDYRWVIGLWEMTKLLDFLVNACVVHFCPYSEKNIAAPFPDFLWFSGSLNINLVWNLFQVICKLNEFQSTSESILQIGVFSVSHRYDRLSYLNWY